MKKIYICLLLAILLVTIVVFNIKTNKKTIELDGIRYLVSIDGVLKDSFPSKGSYTVKMGCVNAQSNWNYQEWVAEIYDITGDVSCEISFTSPDTTFVDYIKSLIPEGEKSVGSYDMKDEDGNLVNDGSTLEKIDDYGLNDYRYRGIDPNNYVIFNNELWRIIGVFDERSHGIADTHLVKIIRNDSIGGYSWGVSALGSVNYSNSEIYQLLNDGYYESINGTNESYCYVDRRSLKSECNFTGRGIHEEYRDMIEKNSKWFFGDKKGANTYTSFEMYMIERNYDRFDYESVKGTPNAESVSGPIGLMYVSDYGYAAPSSCANGTDLDYYFVTNCANKDWLKSNYYEWTINSSVIFSDGFVNTNYENQNSSENGASIRPTLYLKSDVYYIAGTGTQGDPYIISI